jgi:simple sugar transport system permease protein
MAKESSLASSHLTFTVISVILGLVVGAVVLAIAGYNPAAAYWSLLQGVFSRPRYIFQVIIRATPIIITGFSVAFAFRTGLFNIGAEGQFIVGALTAAVVGYHLPLPPVIHVLVLLMLAMIAGGIWGGIAGFLKARFGIHEVIVTIMLNWIALYLNNFFTNVPALVRPESESTHKILLSARIDFFAGLKQNPDQWREFYEANPGLADIFFAPVNLGIFIAVLAGVIMWFVLYRSTLGYELRAVGHSRDAAEYGGINVSASILKSMFVAGMLGGLAGAVHVSGVSQDVSRLAVMEGYGFDGIAVALIGGSTSLGCVLAGLLFGALQYGGSRIQRDLGAPTEVINIVIGTIIFFVAMPKLMRMFLAWRRKRQGGET